MYDVDRNKYIILKSLKIYKNEFIIVHLINII